MKIILAKNIFSKIRGLMFVPKSRDSALAIYQTSQVHTFFMRFPISLVFLDSELKVLRIVKSLSPWKISPKVAGSVWVIEFPADNFSEDLPSQLATQLKSLLS